MHHCGTALTESQGRLLRKYSNQIILGYDSDGAGQAAIVRGMDILSNMGADVRILQMEGAKDPDEYVIKYGSGRFQRLMDEAISLVEYKVKILKKNANLASTSDKIKFLNDIAKILSKTDNKIEQEIYIDRISKEYEISKEAIYAQINKLQYGKKQELPNKEPVKKLKVEDKIQGESLLKENFVIALLINYGKSVYDQIKDEISPKDFKLEQNEKIVQKMYEEFEKGQSNIESVETLFTDEACISQITGILAEDFEIRRYAKRNKRCALFIQKGKINSKEKWNRKNARKPRDKWGWGKQIRERIKSNYSKLS